MTKKLRLLAVIVFTMALAGGLVWAALELAGQSNKTAADAGSSAADMEMASLDSIKPSTKAPSSSQSKESSLRSKVDQADRTYKSRLSKAQSEVATNGKVSEGTRSAGLAAARAYKAACDEYARYWDSQNCASRADLARQTGASRVASAEMAFNDISSDRVNAYNRQQDALRKAQSAYFKDAKEDVSDSDRASIKSNMTARLKKVGGDLTSLMGTVAGLLTQIQQKVGGSLTPAAIGGCAKQALSTGTSPAAAAADGVAELLSPLQSLLSLLKSMSSNVQGMLSDLGSL